MKAEELYKKEYGDAESIPKEAAIRLLKHFAVVLAKKDATIKELRDAIEHYLKTPMYNSDEWSKAHDRLSALINHNHE